MQITLRAARVNAGLTQAQVEKTTGIARSTLVRWENGKGFPRTDDLAILCELYGIPADSVKGAEAKTRRRRIGPKESATLAVGSQRQHDRGFIPETADGPCTDTTKVEATASSGGSPTLFYPGTNMTGP